MKPVNWWSAAIVFGGSDCSQHCWWKPRVLLGSQRCCPCQEAKFVIHTHANNALDACSDWSLQPWNHSQKTVLWCNVKIKKQTLSKIDVQYPTLFCQQQVLNYTLKWRCFWASFIYSICWYTWLSLSLQGQSQDTKALHFEKRTGFICEVSNQCRSNVIGTPTRGSIQTMSKKIKSIMCCMWPAKLAVPMLWNKLTSGRL